ncbi:hypothetical protein U9M48_027515 [Paspalum notatum var. saurae]|uniref:Uncharacterized protein n=1 Tax=Paspalum notatum var. saurae TaxID=547442 RepID=A0AAQ3TZL4_PASNO
MKLATRCHSQALECCSTACNFASGGHIGSDWLVGSLLVRSYTCNLHMFGCLKEPAGQALREQPYHPSQAAHERSEGASLLSLAEAMRTLFTRGNQGDNFSPSCCLLRETVSSWLVFLFLPFWPFMMMKPMDRQWMYTADRRSKEFIAETTMGDAEDDEDVEDINALGEMLQTAEKYCDNKNVRKKLERMMEDHKTPLYLDFKGGTLEVAEHVGTVAMEGNKWYIRQGVYSVGNKLPETTYEAKEVICPIGLKVQKRHACPNECILYRGKELEDLEACPVCKASWHKIRQNDVEGEPPRKRVPTKVMWYFLIIPQLKHLFQNKNTKMVRGIKKTVRKMIY